MPEIIAVADDLSGAVETAAALAGRDADGLLRGDCLVLRTTDDIASATADIVVVDTDSRDAGVTEAVGILGTMFDRVDDGVPVFKKIDSQLRGNTAAELRELRQRSPVVATPALPALGRTLIDGFLTVGAGDGVFTAERLGPLDVTKIGLASVRAGVSSLSVAIADATAGDGVIVVDAATDADLDTLVDAVRQTPVILAGSAALAAAIGRRLRASGTMLAPTNPRPFLDDRRVRPTAIIVGTNEPTALMQFLEAERTGMPSVRVQRDSDIRELFMRRAQDRRPVALLVDAEYAGGMTDRDCLRRLAAAVAGHLVDHDLVLTGGETARRVLDALGDGPLHPVREIHWGAVLSVSENGRLVATRPGSFGGRSSLLEMADAIGDLRSLGPRPQRKGPVL